MIARVALSPRPVEPSPQPSPPRSKPRPIRPQPKRPFEFVCLINAVLKNPPIRHAREAEAMCDHVWIFEAPGTADVYTIVVTNNGPSTVSSVTLTDTIPAALLNPSFGPSAGIYDLGTGVWSGAEPGDRPERDHDA
jgi:uncharacterized repeat protein (TIGR01451 family)